MLLLDEPALMNGGASMPHRHPASLRGSRGKPDETRSKDKDGGGRPEGMDERHGCRFQVDHIAENLPYLVGRKAESRKACLCRFRLQDSDRVTTR